MSTIVVYKRQPHSSGATNKWENFSNADDAQRAAERRDGMKDAGDMLRDVLSVDGGSVDDDDADNRVKHVIETLRTEEVESVDHARKISLYDIRFEVGDTEAERYRVRGETPKGFLRLRQPATGRKARLNLSVKLDDLRPGFEKRFRMNVTVPREARDATSWDYLRTNINEDLNVIEAAGGGTVNENIENYLIATFAFTRCR